MAEWLRALATGAEGSEFTTVCTRDISKLSVHPVGNGYSTLRRTGAAEGVVEKVSSASWLSNGRFPTWPLAEGEPILSSTTRGYHFFRWFNGTTLF